MSARRPLALLAACVAAGAAHAMPVGPTRAAAPTHAAAPASLTAQVDPFIGTDGTGHTFPGAVRPFGMVAPSPDNDDHGWAYASGYQDRAPKILGFSNTHISGAGIPELGDVLLQPAAGRPWSAATVDFSAAYDKAGERARPGDYRVSLPPHGVRVELTATQRVALQRYTFTRPGAAQVLVDLQHGLRFGDAAAGAPGRVTQATAAVDAARGEVGGTVFSKNWVERQASFALRFDHPIRRVTTLPPRPGEQAPRYLLDFELGGGRTLEVRVALSSVDEAGAWRNLADAQGRGFARVRREADREWEALLGRVRIEADAGTRRVFYSALYRTLIHPSDIADADGRVRGPRGQVMPAPGGHYYSTLSLWDTFRGVHPLLALVAPERVDGFVQTLLAHQRQQGYLPLWTAWGRETWTMIGNPALPVIAHALAAGFHGFDADAALAAMIATSTEARPDAPAWAQRDWTLYTRHGYLPFDQVDNESVSRSLEYGIGDDAVARVATALGRPEVAARFQARAAGYRALYDSTTRTMRGKDAAGRWRTPFDPLVATSPMNNPGDYTEANAWQYTATPALHDPEGLRTLLGGPQALQDWLDTFFSLPAPLASKELGQEALIGQYAHGNEPSHHIAYLYAFTNAPWRGQALIRRIAHDFYPDRHDGILGNDDCGQMSAWLVLSTLGFYPVTPARAEFVLGTPLVASARVQVPGRRALTIRAEGFGAAHPFARSVTLDGRPLAPTALRHADLAAGGTLRIEMVGLP